MIHNEYEGWNHPGQCSTSSWNASCWYNGLSQGVPETLLPTYRNAANVAEGLRGGNPELEPEEADTWTVGLVWHRPS